MDPGSDFISSLAKKPNLQPKNVNNEPYFPNYIEPGVTPKPIEFTQMHFKNLQSNLHLMYNLDEKQNLPVNSSTSYVKGSLPYFLHVDLVDTSKHYKRLCPFPQIQQNDIQYILNEIFAQRIPPSRASWALHMFCYNISKIDGIGNELIELYKQLKDERDHDYFALLAKSCYECNIIKDTTSFLKWLVQNVGPKSLCSFTDDILRTNSILTTAFNANDEFLDILQDHLLLQGSQIIQLLIFRTISNNSSMYKDNFLFFDNQKFNRLVTAQEEFVRRAKKIYNLLTDSGISIVAQLVNVLVENYPIYDQNKLREKVSEISLFLFNPESNKIAIDLCKVLSWFRDFNLTSLSSAVAYTIKYLNIPFPLYSFLDFVFQNHKDCKIFTHIFVELQQLGLINFFPSQNQVESFCHYIKTRRSKYSDQVILDVLYNLPPASIQSQTQMNIFCNLYTRLGSDDFQEILNAIYEQMESGETDRSLVIWNNIELVKQLPLSFQYHLIWFSMNKSNDFEATTKIIFTLNADCYYRIYFKKVYESSKNKAFTIPGSVFVKLCNYLPVLSLCDLLPQFAECVLAPVHSDPVNYDIAMFLYENYQEILPQSKSKLADINKMSKNVTIDSHKTMELFRKYSFLCNLHSLDAFHGIRSKSDFEMVFRVFIGNVLKFRNLNSKTLLRFCIDFVQSGCIIKPIHFMVSTIFSVILLFSEDELDSRLSNLLQDFVGEMFESSIITPSQCITYALDIKKKKSTAGFSFFFNVILKLMEQKHHLFTPSNTLSDNIIKCFPLGTQDFSLLSSLIAGLKNERLPQITGRILKSIDEGVKQMSAKTFTISGAYFSLLPEEAVSSDINVVFNYFKANVSLENYKFLSLWLIHRDNFVQGFPLGFNPNSSREPYIMNLVKFFSSLILDQSEEQNQNDKSTILCSWSFICSRCQRVTDVALSYVCDYLKHTTGISSSLFDFVQSPLVYSNFNSIVLLSDAFLSYNIKSDDEVIPFAMTASASYTSLVSKYIEHKNNDKVYNDVNITKVCEMARHMYSIIKFMAEKRIFQSINFVIDSLNFLCCVVNTRAPNHDMDLFNSIKESFLSLHDNDDYRNIFKNSILLPVSIQNLAPEKPPLFHDFKESDDRPPQQSMPPSVINEPDLLQEEDFFNLLD